MSIDKTLQLLESDGAILDFRFQYKNSLVWPFVRWIYFQEIIYSNSNWDTLVVKNKVSFYGWLKYFYHVIKQNPFYLGKMDIVIATSTISNILNDKGEYFHRLADYFICDSLDTVVLESQNSREFKRPRSFKNVKYVDSIRIYAKIRAKFIKKDKKDIDTINAFIVFLKEKSDVNLSDSFYKKMYTILSETSKELPHLDYAYNRFYDRLQPKIVLFEQASYLSNYLFIKIANERGIKTAEYQHGFIGSQHPAYNYGNFMYESDDFRKTLPKYFLTYGKFWEKNIKLPSKKVTIGNPFLSEQICKYPRKVFKRQQILIVSTGLDIDFVNKLSKKLLLDFKDTLCDIYIRAHPSERFEVIKRYGKVIDMGIKIDKEENLYVSLSSKDIILGDYSTVLFEALAYNSRVFIHNDKSVNLYVKDGEFFDRFNLSDDIRTLLDTKTNKNFKIEEIWENGWKEKYNNFIDGVLDDI